MIRIKPTTHMSRYWLTATSGRASAQLTFAVPANCNGSDVLIPEKPAP